MSRQSISRLVRIFVVLFVVAAGFFAASPASAQSKEEAQKVLSLISEATKAFESKDYATAETKFREAYEIFPDPVLLYRVGLSAEKQDKYRVALESFEKFISAMPDDETAVKLSNRLGALREKVPARVVVNSNPAGAEVRRGSSDGEVIGTTPLETDMEAGEQTVVVILDGYEPAERTLNLQAAEKESIDVRLVAAQTGESEETSSLAIWGWTSVGVGAALIGTGAAFTVLTQNKVDDVNNYNKRAPDASPSELQDLKDQADSNYQTSLVTYIAGGAIATTGVILLIVDAASGDESEESALQLDAFVGPDRAWVGLRGNF